MAIPLHNRILINFESIWEFDKIPRCLNSLRFSSNFSLPIGADLIVLITSEKWDIILRVGE